MSKKNKLASIMYQVKVQRWLRNRRNTGISIAVLFAASAASGCHMTVGTPGAIREYHRGLNGMITEGKTSPDKESAYWQTQKRLDTEHTTRDTAPHWLQGIFSGGAK
jgi:hypothetical protein